MVARSEASQSGQSARTVRVPLQDASHSRKKAQLLAAMERPRPPLPANQRKFKTGTTGFMLAIHVGAVFALLPRFWSLQGVIVLAVLYLATVLGVTLGLHRLVAHRGF